MSGTDTLVLKFGGASLATPQHIEVIADIIQEKAKETKNLVVVVSAMGKTTDELLAMAHTIHPSPPKREVDMLISVGERISMALLAMALSKKGMKALSFTGSQSGILTSDEHSNARIVDVRPKRIQKALDTSHIAIVAGFQGMSIGGEITTLGRGGSDTTAVALAIALQCRCVEFYKDVGGIFTEDPKISANAKQLSKATYDDVLTIVSTGARVLHARAVELAKHNKIALRIRSFYKNNGTCETWVCDETLPIPKNKIYELQTSNQIDPAPVVN